MHLEGHRRAPWGDAACGKFGARRGSAARRAAAPCQRRRGQSVMTALLDLKVVREPALRGGRVAETNKRSRRRAGARVKRAATTHAQRGTVRLRESSEQFRFAQEALGIVTWIWDLRSDRVQWYGDASLLLGLAPRTFSGRFPDYLKHLHPDDVEAAKQTFVD